MYQLQIPLWYCMSLRFFVKTNVIVIDVGVSWEEILNEVVHKEILIKFQAYQRYVRFTCHYYILYVHCWKELLKKICALTMLCLARSLNEVYVFIQAHLYSLIFCVPYQYKNSEMPVFIPSVTRTATLCKLDMLM